MPHLLFPPLLQEGYASGTCPVDPAQLEAAKSGVIYQLIAREKTASAAAIQAMLSHFKQVPLDQNRSALIAMATAGPWTHPFT